MINLPGGWEVLSASESLPMKFHKLYPDGTDVIIEVKKEQNGYEVWSSAEHRASGPNENLEAKSSDIESAMTAAESEMFGWDEYLSKLI